MVPALALRALASALGGAWLAANPVVVVPAGSGRPTCPAPSELEAALVSHFPGSVRSADTEPAPGQLRLATFYATGTLRLEVRNDRGDLLLRRLLPRDEHDRDCRALAESIALIVDRYAHALITEPLPLPTPTPTAPAPTPLPPTPTPTPAPAPTSAPPATPPPAAPSLPAPSVDKPAAPPPAATPPVPPAHPPESPRDEVAPPARSPATPAPPRRGEAAMKEEAPAVKMSNEGSKIRQSHPGTLFGLSVGERFSDGTPTTGEEGRLSVERFSNLQASGWLIQLQTGLARAGTDTNATVGSLELWRFPIRLALGLTRPLGLGQLETSAGLGGDLLLRSWKPPPSPTANPTTHSVRFAPSIDWQGGFRALLSERLSLSLGINVSWAFVRYDLGYTDASNRPTNLLQTPRLSVTPALGLSVRFM